MTPPAATVFSPVAHLFRVHWAFASVASCAATRSGGGSSRLLLKKYLPAVGLWAVVCGAIMLRNRYAAPDVLPPSQAMLFVTALCALLWGAGPGAAVLALSTLVSQAMRPELLLPASAAAMIPPLPAPHADAHLLNASLYFASGAAILWLVGRAPLLRRQDAARSEAVSLLHHMMLPDRLECPDECEIAAYYETATSARREGSRAGEAGSEDVGGDFYDVFPLGGSRKMAVLIGDVMGHGAAAARHTALLRYSARALAARPESTPAQVLRGVAAMIDGQRIAFGTATLFFGVLDTETGALNYASAGHEPPLLMRAEAPGDCESLDSTGMPLGCDAGSDYFDKWVQLNPGDALLLMTDGATESRNAVDDLLGASGMACLLHKTRYAAGAQEALQGIAKGIEAFSAASSGVSPIRRDDTALLLLHWKQAARFGRRIPAA